MTFVLSQGSFDQKTPKNKQKLQNKNQFNYVAIFPYKMYFNTSIINIRSELMSHITVKDKQTKKTYHSVAPTETHRCTLLRHMWFWQIRHSCFPLMCFLQWSLIVKAFNTLVPCLGLCKYDTLI